jgi:isopentenyl diphosphate isomerase/L-lactate dehydrogenase-like FMN-dependent dehydrogenase
VQPINVFDYEKLAQAKMEPAIWDYYQGGSEDEITIQRNRAAFAEIALRPRVLVDVSNLELQTSVLGTPVSMPILVAPVAAQRLAHPEGEIETARGAGKAGTLMIVSTTSTCTLEEIAEAATGPLWFQLYLSSNLQRSKDLLARAEACGYQAIVFTVDVPVMGHRERDLRNQFMLASHTTLVNFLNSDSTDPSIARHRVDTWETLSWLRAHTRLPILLKGILTAEDALLAVEHGADGIMVSNHGGRQLDGAIASIEALPEIAETVAGRCEIYLDGGIRRGTDVLKALALGARAVLTGRPIIWGLAANGSTGVAHVLELLRAELKGAMALSGCPTLASIHPSLVRLRNR